MDKIVNVTESHRARESARNARLTHLRRLIAAKLEANYIARELNKMRLEQSWQYSELRLYVRNRDRLNELLADVKQHRESYRCWLIVV